MNIPVITRLQEAKRSYMFRASISLLLTACASCAWVATICDMPPSEYQTFVLYIAIFSTLLTFAALYWQMQFYRQHTRKVLFLLDAIANNDYTIQFDETKSSAESRLIHRALNQVTRMLYNVKSEIIQREKYYELILECVNTGIVVLNEKGVVYQKNSEALKLLGIEIFTHIKQLARVDLHLMEALEKCRPGDKLQLAYSNERNTVNLSIRVSGITIHEEPLRILALNDINHELDEKEIDSWSRLTRVLTHEIMNSVTPITSLSDTLLELVGQTPKSIGNHEKRSELLQGLQTISSTGKGLLSFVESYRRFTRIPQPEPGLFFVKGFINRMVQLAQHQYPDTQITFQTDVTPADLILHADENLIAQVITNLLKNAIQAIEQQTAKTDNGRIHIQAYCNKEEAVLIEISNNGPRIPAEIADQIFIPFFTTREGGNGIGLSISRQIMRMSNGNISLLPTEETTFRLTFY